MIYTRHENTLHDAAASPSLQTETSTYTASSLIVTLQRTTQSQPMLLLVEPPVTYPWPTTTSYHPRGASPVAKIRLHAPGLAAARSSSLPGERSPVRGQSSSTSYAIIAEYASKISTTHERGESRSTDGVATAQRTADSRQLSSEHHKCFT